MRRVVITGLGIVSSIGNNKSEVLESLQNARSGIVVNENYTELGFNTGVEGAIDINIGEHIPRKWHRFMGNAAAYCYIAMKEAIADAKLSHKQVSNQRTGLILGSGGASTENVAKAVDLLRKRGLRKVGPFMVPRTMSSTTSACIATPFNIRGLSYSISSACATSAHCIGNAMEQIKFGNQDIIFAGGGEEVHWTMTLLFDAMGALSSKFNDNPATASRPFDKDRDGFVMSGGGGVIVLEELEHAIKRGANIYAELVGYAANSDGYDMVQPSGDGAIRCMEWALRGIRDNVDYINAHGTGTPIGDKKELESIKAVFRGAVPLVGSTKSLTGHALGAAGVHEAIYSLLMMEGRFLSASVNIETLDESAHGIPIITKAIRNHEVKTVMSNSFGFGGTNVSLVFQAI